MVELWFGIAALTITAYVVLDGFDLGAGALHHVVARSDAERRQVLAAIGPFWDGNEVWLLATGGVLFVAFPPVLAAGLSGFYFAIFLVLWTLILRGVAIEFRSHLEDHLWRAAWDAIFAAASATLPVLFGAALGNLVRGLPLDRDGWFSLTLFTDWSAAPPVGILDWYSVSCGAFALIALAGHGATYLAWKTDGPVHERSHRLAGRLYALVAVLWPVLTLLTFRVNAPMLGALPARPLAWAALAAAVLGLVGVRIGLRRGRPLHAFLSSCGFLGGMLAATAACAFPVMLRSVPDADLSLTAYNSGVPAASLRTALAWSLLAFPLVALYFATLFRLHRGKAVAASAREGY
ncbi:MAG TPA: cytochrome d ubiquinol oxidase subunit II [Vicinamibacteria bacterium]|nr:cytochrome d ubiquinol oxidase subunit II [Vicinamibacteria bacterium]